MGFALLFFMVIEKMFIKDHEHLRRLNSQQASADVLVF